MQNDFAFIMMIISTFYVIKSVLTAFTAEKFMFMRHLLHKDGLLM